MRCCLKIVSYAYYLVCSDEIIINTGKSEYHSCSHSTKRLLERGHSITLSHSREAESYDSDSYQIFDCTQETPYDFDINEYNNITDRYTDYPPEYRSIAKLYVNFDGESTERCIIDVLFHYFHDLQNPDTNYIISDNMKQCILRFAKIVIGEEINYNLKGVTPVYDTERMEPAWNVNSLLSAMYLSLFYLKPNMELYRPCGNPRCSNYFLVRATSSKTKYCCTKCANSVTQARYRKKKK